MASEEKHGIVKQPAETCPTVDECLKNIEQAESDLKGWERMELDELRFQVDYALWRLDAAKDELEKARQSNIALREWGQEWKDLAKSLDESHAAILG